MTNGSTWIFYLVAELGMEFIKHESNYALYSHALGQ